MISITKDLAIADGPSLVLFTPEGDYADTDLILYAERKNPTLPTAQLQAQFVKYGPIVYQFNTPEDLGKALYEIDPESTHDAVALYKEELARDAARNSGTLAPSDPVPAEDSPEPAPLPEEVEPDTQFFKEQAAEDAASSTPPTTPELPVIEAGDPEVLGTTTDDSILDSPPPASTTPDMMPIGDISSTTPDIVIPDPAPAVEASTTTP